MQQLRNDARDRLITDGLARARAIAEIVGGWSASHRAQMRRMLSAAMQRLTLEMETGGLTLPQAAAWTRSRIEARAGTIRPNTIASLVDEVLLIFVTALRHADAPMVAELCARTLQCVRGLIEERLPGEAAASVRLSKV
jgi:hypothetical protein